MDEGIVTLQSMHQDNYNTILDVYDYVNVEGVTSINADMDKAIEKLTTVATIHDVSNYLDDCYVLIGKAQYLKQDYAAALETFQYFEEEFDPKNPYGRVYKANNKKKSSKDKRKELEQARKEKDKERKEEAKEREKEREQQKKEREEKDKQRKKEAKDRKKSRGKKSRSTKSRNPISKDKEETPEVKVDKVDKEAIEANKAAAEAREKEIEEELKRKKEEEEKKKNEEKKYEREGEGAIWKNKTAYTFGLYWLARTYIEQQRFGTAKYVIDKLEGTAGLSDDIAKQLPAAKAHLYLQTKDYTLALVELETAINKEKNRRNKARYAFIKAQLYEKSGNTAMAYEEYGRAKKYSPDHEMELNAKINEVKLAYNEGQSSRENVLSKLEKLLSERKNQQFKDQILFAIAQVKLDGGDIDGAIADFESAISQSSGNKNIQLEANYKLGYLLFDRGLYSEAKSKFDAVLSVMSKQDERLRQVEILSTNLTAIANNINTIELQDSLLALSLKPQDELREIALEELRERDADLAAASNKGNSPTPNSNVIRSNEAVGAARSSFFAYNPVVLNQGKIEFQRIWGDIAVGDNWRRSLRSDISNSFDTDLNESEPEEKVYTEKEIDSVLKGIPRTPEQKAKADAKISEALFELGTLFRDRIRDYSKSVEVLERLNTEYPNFAKRDEALFYLYLSYSDLPDNANAIKVLEMMKQEFPDSKFTKIATDPAYAKSLSDSDETIASYYDKTYELFEAGNYNEVIERSRKKTELFPGKKEFAAKFALINAMSLGSLEGKERYVKELQQVIRAFPKSDEEKRAQEILRFLNGDQQAFNEILFDEALDAFEAEDEKLHYVFVITYDLGHKEFDKYKLDISNYNKKYHRFENLKLSNIYLNVEEKSQIILIRSFENKEKAMKYYDGVQKNKSEYVTKTKTDFDIFVSTQKNYREVIKQRSANNYRVFFDKNYLGKK
jgi:tetratricopeptide (TPR) repeat protein